MKKTYNGGIAAAISNALPFGSGDDVYPIPQPPSSCDCGPTAPNNRNCGYNPRSPARYARGQCPILVPLCEGDAVLRSGRVNAAWVPGFVIENVVARSASFSPREPLAAEGTKTGSPLVLTLSADAPTVNSVDEGNAYLFFGMMLEIGTSDNVTPGTTTVQMSGVFEDDQTYNQTFQLSQASAGNSRFLLLFTREAEGGSYPSLVRVQNGIFATGDVAYALTAAAAPNDATSIDPTYGLRGPTRDVSVTITTGPQNTVYRAELITPVSAYFDIAVDVMMSAIGKVP